VSFHAAAARAAGIVGNIQQELAEPERTGVALFQDIGSRPAPGRGSTTQQLEAAWRELQGLESGTHAALKATRTPQEAARVFSERFERPGCPTRQARLRACGAAAAGH
jgi:hypothetical protein